MSWTIRIFTIAALVAAVVLPAASASPACRPPPSHPAPRHSKPKGHRYLCSFHVVSELEVSKEGGLGRIDIHKGLAAVLQRDEGIVTLLDVHDPSRPQALGSYDDGAQDSLDGDVAFSSDGEWLFYARQTVQFSKDGVHVLDVSDPAAPALASYQPGGGTFRLDYYKTPDAEYVIVLDAVDGLVVNRFVRETGTLVQVFRDSTPATKVGGPASAGLFIDKKDPKTGAPLLYVTTGMTGLQIYDLSDPEMPEIVGEWSDVGLAEVERKIVHGRRMVYAATEYWFDKSLEPEIVVLDVTKLDAIKEVDRWGLGLPADDLWRVQGMDVAGKRLVVANSHAGIVAFDLKGRVRRVASLPNPGNESSGATGAPYAMDVEAVARRFFVTDAASGYLSFLIVPPPLVQ